MIDFDRLLKLAKNEESFRDEPTAPTEKRVRYAGPFIPVDKATPDIGNSKLKNKNSWNLFGTPAVEVPIDTLKEELKTNNVKDAFMNSFNAGIASLSDKQKELLRDSNEAQSKISRLKNYVEWDEIDDPMLTQIGGYDRESESIGINKYTQGFEDEDRIIAHEVNHFTQDKLSGIPGSLELASEEEDWVRYKERGFEGMSHLAEGRTRYPKEFTDPNSEYAIHPFIQYGTNKDGSGEAAFKLISYNKIVEGYKRSWDTPESDKNLKKNLTAEADRLNRLSATDPKFKQLVNKYAVDYYKKDAKLKEQAIEKRDDIMRDMYKKANPGKELPNYMKKGYNK